MINLKLAVYTYVQHTKYIFLSKHQMDGTLFFKLNDFDYPKKSVQDVLLNIHDTIDIYNHNIFLCPYAVARVGIDPTFIRVDETVGFVEICAVVFEPVITCPIDFDFSVSLSTCDGTAGVYRERISYSINIPTQRL